MKFHINFNTTLSYAVLLLSKILTYKINLKFFYNNESKKLMENSKSIIFTLWHHDIPILMYAYRNRGYYPVVSLSKDGELVIPTLIRFGYGYIRGSSTRGGVKALKIGTEILNNEKSVVLTVDGPIGPRYSVKKGAVYLSQRTKKPIIPVVAALKKKIILNTWDRMEIPLPFNIGTVYVGEPIYCTGKNVDDCVSHIREYMLNLEQMAEKTLKKRILLRQK